MAYIGREPQIGNFQVCDAISVVNGQAAYTMQVSSVNVVPETANHMLVSLNGVIQKPGSSYTVSGSTITFASNLATGDVINFIHILGSVLDLGVPSDATVTNAKTNFVSTSSAAGLQIKGDGTTDGTLQLNCSQNSHGIKLKSPAHSAGASYTLTFPVNDGNANQFLQTNGSGVLSFADAGSDFVKIAETSSLNASTVDYNSSLITSDYKTIQINFNGLGVANDNEDIYIRVSVDNGSNFPTHYPIRAYMQMNASGNQNFSGNNNAGGGVDHPYHPIGQDVEATAGGGGVSGTAWIYDIQGTAEYKWILSLSTTLNSNGNYYYYYNATRVQSTSAINFIRILNGAGNNIDSGTIQVFGYK